MYEKFHSVSILEAPFVSYGGSMAFFPFFTLVSGKQGWALFNKQRKEP